MFSPITSDSRRRPVRLVACPVILGVLLLVIASPHAAGQQYTAPHRTIASAGPLDEVYLGPTLDCQVRHTSDAATNALEVYHPFAAPADCGTFASVDGQLYAPGFAHGVTATGSIQQGNPPLWREESQSSVQGAGTRNNPFRVRTVVEAGNTGFRVDEESSYIVGTEYYRTATTIINSSDAPIEYRLSHAMDCYLGASDYGFGVVSPSDGGRTTVACSKNAENTPPGRIEGFIPIDGGNAFQESNFNTIWTHLGSDIAWSNACTCATLLDNGMAIGWEGTLAPGARRTYSYLTVFAITSEQLPDPPPQCRDIGVETPPGTPVGVELPCDGIIDSRRVVDGPQNGTIAGDPSTGAVTYTPNPGFSGTDTFTFLAANEVGDSNLATATISVPGPPVPDEPIPQTPAPGPQPREPQVPVLIKSVTVNPLVKQPDPRVRVVIACEGGPRGVCFGQVRTAFTKRAFRIERRKAGIVRVRLARYLRRAVRNCSARRARARVTVVVYQPDGAPLSRRSRIVQLRRAGCQRPRFTG